MSFRGFDLFPEQPSGARTQPSARSASAAFLAGLNGAPAVGLGSHRTTDTPSLRAVRQSVQEQIGKSFDLNEDLTPAGGPRLTDLRVTADDDITVSARLA